jgi:hypothetical protein
MLIGLLGEARSGKDTVADAILSRYRGRRMSFAAPLKAVARMVYDLSEAQVNGDLKEQIDVRYDVTPRYILQVLGTDAFRKLIYNNTWVDYWARAYSKTFDPTEVTIITDVRFKNEMQAIKDEKGVIWKLVRDDGPGAQGGIAGHASEVEQNSILDKEFNAVIVAKSGDLEGLINSALTEYQKLATILTEAIE